MNEPNDTVLHTWYVDIYKIFPELKHPSEIITIHNIRYTHDVKAHSWAIREAMMAEKIVRGVR